MMKKDWSTERFLELLWAKYPQRKELINVLMQILPLEKESIYRRLRGEVIFSFPEVVKIAEKLNLSLDHVVGLSSHKNRPFQIRFIDFDNPTPLDFEMQYQLLDLFSTVEKDPTSEVAIAGNLIPINFCMAHDHIYRFHRLKWFYQFGSKPRTFKEVVLYDKIKPMIDEFVKRSKNIAHSYFVWDHRTTPSLIDDIQYFHSINLIDDDDIQLLKKDLIRFFNNLEQIAIHGEYPGTNKKVYIYIASISFETSFSYYKTKDYQISNIRSFNLNDIVSNDQQVFEKINKWMHALIRTSTLISGSNEIQRIPFFNEQRKIVESL